MAEGSLSYGDKTVVKSKLLKTLAALKGALANSYERRGSFKGGEKLAAVEGAISDFHQRIIKAYRFKGVAIFKRTSTDALNLGGKLNGFKVSAIIEGA